MAEDGFTPGKWEAGDVRYQRDFRTFVNVMAPHGLVACVSSDPQHPETIDANARLIAASPTLLEALIAAESLFNHTFAMNGTIHKQIRTAITLATGKDA